jgi:putative glutamine amidotransferase
MFRSRVAVTATLDGSGSTPRVRINAAYLHALEAAGLLPLVVGPLVHPQQAGDVLEGLDGLVLTGGEDVSPGFYGAVPHPALGSVNEARDRTELALLQAARQRRLPVLAICRGVQLANVALGGTLIQDIASERPGSLAHQRETERDARVHDVHITAGSALAEALGDACARVNSFHHQALDRVAPELRVTATAPDGIIEGVESAGDWWFLGVQWHPEELTRTVENWDRGLFAAFARAAAQRGR